VIKKVFLEIVGADPVEVAGILDITQLMVLQGAFVTFRILEAEDRPDVAQRIEAFWKDLEAIEEPQGETPEGKILLSRVAAEGSEGAARQERSEAREDRQPLAKPIKKILVVDDYKPSAEMAAMVLEDAGFEVEFVYSGSEALEKLRTFVPDAILSDVRMPKMTGPEWVQQAAKIEGFERVPVVFMSGDVEAQSKFDREVKDLAQQRPAHFLHKPFDIGVLRAAFMEPEKHFKYWPARSEARDEVEKPLNKIPAEKVRKIFVFGHKGHGTEKLGEDLILYAHFVPLLLEKFPDAQVHMAIDYQNIFSAERYRGKVFPVSDSLYSAIYDPDGRGFMMPMEPRDGMIPPVFAPPGSIKKTMRSLAEADELGQWIVEQDYDLVFDFSTWRLASYFEKARHPKMPVIFSNMFRILVSTDFGYSPNPNRFQMRMQDASGIHGVKGLGSIYRYTRHHEAPVFWEIFLRVYRALGLLPDPFDLQKVDALLPPLHDEEKQWVFRNLASLLIKKGMSPEMAQTEILDGKHKFVFVNVFAQSNLKVFKEEQWAELLSRFFIPDPQRKIPGEDVYLVFSRGGFKDHEDQWILESILEKLGKTLGPEKSRFLLLAPENLSIGRVQGFMQAMDFVITPDTGFSHLATAFNVPQVEFLPFPKERSLWKTYRRHSFVIDTEFLDALKDFPESGYERILKFIQTRLSENSVPRKNTCLKISGVPPAPLRRSEQRSREEQLRAFDVLRDRLHERDGRFLDEMKRMRAKAVRRMAYWKPKPYFFDLRQLFRLWKEINRRAELGDGFVSAKLIQSLKGIAERISVDFETQRKYKGSAADMEALTPLRNSLERWAMGWYEPVSYRGKERSDTKGHNRAIQEYIRREANAWLMGMTRFIEVTPEYQTKFLKLAETFPGTVWEWSREPWNIPVKKEKRLDYIESILNRWHKFERSKTGELVDLYPPERKLAGEDQIGTERRRQIFLFAEGLFFMAQAAKRFRYFQLELPLEKPKSSLQRSELRGSTSAIREVLMQDMERGGFDQVQTLVPGADLPQIEFAAQWTEGLYSEGISQDPDRAWLWIAGRLAQNLEDTIGKQGVSNHRLAEALDTVQKAMPAGIHVPSIAAVDLPQIHLRVSRSDANDWLVLIREHFPLVLGTLNRLHEKLVINVENSERVREIRAAIVQAAQDRRIFLSRGQVQVLVSEKAPFASLAKITSRDNVAIATTSAADLNKVGRRKGVNSRWLLDGNIKDEKAQFAAGIVTMLHAILDRNIGRDAIHQPSEFKALLSAAIHAVQAYAKVLASA
jgi:CheY-like chemotaxis protein